MKAVRLVVVLDCEDLELLAAFWSQAIGYRLSGSLEPYCVLVPEQGEGVELVLQRVPEPKTAKNRMHLDILTDDLDSSVQRLCDLGARKLQPAAIEQHGFRWIVMADPEGNEFCVCVEPRSNT